MALRAVLTNEEYGELEEALQALYKQNQAGDAWVLDVEGVDSHPLVKGMATTLRKFKEITPDVNALKAFKEEHEETKTQLQVLQELWGELDAEETKAALTRLEELESEGGKVDIEARVEAAKSVLERKHGKVVDAKDAEIGTLTETVAEKDSFITELVIEQELDAGLTHIKALPELREGAKALIHRNYYPTIERSEDEVTGKPLYKGVIKTDLGETSIADFFERWQTEEEALPYLPGSGNTGTGSKSKDDLRGRRKINPWTKEHWNLTEQGRIVKDNPALAKQLAAAAGVELKLTT